MNALQQGVLITAIGMGLVFVMIIVLWGIMAGLVALFKAKPESEEEEAAEEVVNVAEPEDEGATVHHQLAAATAVAYALAQQQTAVEQDQSLTTRWNQSTRAYQPFRQHRGW